MKAKELSISLKQLNVLSFMEKDRLTEDRKKALYDQYVNGERAVYLVAELSKKDEEILLLLAYTMNLEPGDIVMAEMKSNGPITGIEDVLATGHSIET